MWPLWVVLLEGVGGLCESLSIRAEDLMGIIATGSGGRPSTCVVTWQCLARLVAVITDCGKTVAVGRVSRQ
jgi:hypothetical protein